MVDKAGDFMLLLMDTLLNFTQKSKVLITFLVNEFIG